jgi:hypothetical protein
LPPAAVPSEYTPAAMRFCIEVSATLMRPSMRSIICSRPEFLSWSRPETMMGQAACLKSYCAAVITSCAATGSRSYPEYQPTLPFSAKEISSRMSEPPETVRTLPRSLSLASNALFLDTLSCMRRERASMVVATMSVRFGNAMVAPP